MLLALVPVMIAVATVAPSKADHATHTAAAKVPAAKAEKMICKRNGATESRMGSKRICKTAAQWRRNEGTSTDGDQAGLGSKQ